MVATRLNRLGNNSAAGARLLDNCYSKTLIDTQSMKAADIKKVNFE